MSATDELRRMLTDAGAEYEGGERSVRWRDRHGIMMQAFPLANGELGMGVWSCTPEQAIAATLGDSDATEARRSDAVEVVRCRDCEHSLKDGTLCQFFASWVPIAGGDEYAEMPADVEPDGFCAWASRKESA